MNKRYNKKMTDMIQHAYRKAGEGVNQLDTAASILKDYKTLWPGSKKLTNLTPEKIRSKFHTLKTQGVYVVSKNVKEDTPDINVNDVSIKKLTVHLINRSDNLDVTVNDNKVTVQFDL